MARSTQHTNSRRQVPVVAHTLHYISASEMVYEVMMTDLILHHLIRSLASVFGVDREIVTVNKEGISGSEISKHSAEQKGAKFEEKNTADVYRVTISGLASTKLNPEDREMALKDLQNAVDKLTQALTTAYGDQVIVEVLALSEPVKSPSRHDEQMTLIRRKRAADMTETDTNLKTWRESLNVYVFTSTDYPAMFAIFAGLVIALVLVSKA
ncbi:hypothetical protein COOONC_12323 [Cooperia oncophora]